jgi:hypothetical protein
MILIDGIIFSLQKQGGISVYFKTLIEYISKTRENAALIFDDSFDNRIGIDEESISIYCQNSRFF